MSHDSLPTDVPKAKAGTWAIVAEIAYRDAKSARCYMIRKLRVIEQKDLFPCAAGKRAAAPWDGRLWASLGRSTIRDGIYGNLPPSQGSHLNVLTMRDRGQLAHDRLWGSPTSRPIAVRICRASAFSVYVFRAAICRLVRGSVEQEIGDTYPGRINGHQPPASKESVARGLFTRGRPVRRNAQPGAPLCPRRHQRSSFRGLAKPILSPSPRIHIAKYPYQRAD